MEDFKIYRYFSSTDKTNAYLFVKNKKVFFQIIERKNKLVILQGDIPEARIKYMDNATLIDLYEFLFSEDFENLFARPKCTIKETCKEESLQIYNKLKNYFLNLKGDDVLC